MPNLSYKTYGPLRNNQITAANLPSPDNVNIVLLDGSLGTFNLNALLSSSLGLPDGGRLVFRFSVNPTSAFFTTTLAGEPGVPSPVTLTITNNFSSVPEQIELLWTGSNWVAEYAPFRLRVLESIAGVDPGYDAIDVTSRTALQDLINHYAEIRRPLVLPKRTYVIDCTGASGIGLSLPTNTEIVGNGSTLKFTNCPQAGSFTGMRQDGDNLVISDLNVEWAAGNFPVTGSNAYIFGAGNKNGQVLKNVVLQGPGEIQKEIRYFVGPAYLYTVNNIRWENVTCKWSLGATFGADMQGIKNAIFNRCRFEANGADGLNPLVA